MQIHCNLLILHDFCIIKTKNFKIIQGKAKDSLYLKLTGGFEESSAHELFNTLLEHGASYYQIFIDTNELKTIHSFEIEIFQKKSSRLNPRFRIIQSTN